MNTQNLAAMEKKQNINSKRKEPKLFGKIAKIHWLSMLCVSFVLYLK